MRRFACLILLLLTVPATAAEPSPTTEPPVPLSHEQEAIRVRFARFEDTLLKMARYLQKTEPARAELVMRALRRSGEERVAERMELISRMLKADGQAARYADALEEQRAILASLKELLTILRSEDILDDNRREQERLKELARQVAVLIDETKVHQAAASRGDSTDRVAKAQERTAEKTGEVVEGIDAHDAKGEAEAGEKGKAGEPKPGEGKPGDKKPGDGKPADAKPGEAKPGEAKPSESKPGEGKPGEGKPGEGKPGEGKPGEGKPGEGQPGESQPGESPPGEAGESQPSNRKQTPGREELEQARERMERAIEELKNQNRGKATEEQEEAIRKLIEAKDKIEELLRQLREEERELVLRALEARFQKMLALQQTVLERTRDLSGQPNADWQDRDFAKCRDAAATEREIAIEADKALEVLRAEGSSVAFPEAVEQLGEDIANVAGRLGREDAGALTVAIETDIVEALREMIDALQKEMEKLRDKKKKQPPGQSGQAGDPALVDKLAELKMLRTLQLRINRRTRTLGTLFPGEQATDAEMIGQLRELGDRQGRIQRATYDLAAGKAAN